MSTDDILGERAARDKFLREHYASPMPDEDQAVFAGLDYFDHDEQWRLAVLYQEEPPSEVAVLSTSGTTSGYMKVATVTLAIGASTYRLSVIDDGDGGAFIPFRDGTCGEASYGGGRYVDVEHAGVQAFVDFNRARNPWCVYDEEFVCPLPPQENWIIESIPAGEKDYVKPS
ncbi:MAG: DUF1684 domain-containing protein [Actinomycetota bacterium]